MKILELNNISYTYGRGTPFERRALDSVSLGIEKGSITGIIGHTGSGKSTLVQLLVGLIKPDEGTVIFNSQNVWENPKKPQGVKFNIGLVMQYPEYQLFDETVLADISFAPKNMKLSPKQINERVKEAAAYTGLGEELLEKSPFDLSGGQKRRVAIAGVLAMRPQVLVLDEPAAGLDPKGRAEILGGLRAYRDKTGTSIVIVSHSMEDIARYCDDIIVINDGKIKMHDTAEKVFSCPDLLSECGLNIPDVTRICTRLRESGMPIPSSVLTVEQACKVIHECFENKRRGINA